ncbi:MAG: Ig-like domain-containing protein [Candidatus Eremiobacterota bacterium]
MSKLHRLFACFALLALALLGPMGCGENGAQVGQILGAIVERLELTPLDPTIPVGTNQQFRVLAHLNNNQTQDVTPFALWTSSDPTIASIDANGLASGLRPGQVTITATREGTTLQTTLTVIGGVTLQGLAITPQDPTIPVRMTQQFTATGTFSDGSTLDLTATVTWTSGTPNVATISNGAGTQGRATGLTAGVTQITATDPTTGLSASTSLTVTGQGIAALDVTPPAATIRDATQQFTATATLADGTQVDVTTSVTWTTSDNTIATISNAPGTQGVALGLRAGRVTVTATDPVSGLSDTAQLTVLDRFLAITLNATSQAGGELAIVDLADNSVQRTVIPGAVGALRVDISPDGQTFYVATGLGPQTTFAIRRADMTVISQTADGAEHRDVHVHPDGTRVYVSGVFGGTDGIRIYDPADLTNVLGTMATDANPLDFVLSPDGSLISLVCTVRTSRMNFILNESLPPTPFDGPDGDVDRTQDGAVIWAADGFNSTLMAFDGATQGFLGALPVQGSDGGNFPEGVAIARGADVGIAALRLSIDAVLFDPVNRTVTGTIPHTLLSFGSNQAAINFDGTVAALNTDSATVDPCVVLLDLTTGQPIASFTFLEQGGAPMFPGGMLFFR